MTSRVTAVILTWNSASFVTRALESLAREGERVPLDVIVVDNGSTDPSLEIVATVAPSARVIRNEVNLGVAQARNQGARAAGGEYILFLDSDAEMTQASLEQMVRFLDAHPRVAIVGPKLVYPDGRLQYSCRKFPTVPGKALRLLPLAWRRAVPWVADEEMLDLDRSRPQPVDYLIGACQLVRRQALEALGWLDERMFYGPEDVDLCLRAWQAGWQVCYLPQAVVMHAEQRRTHRRLDRLTWRHSRALAYYFWKHRYVWRRPRVGRESPRGSAGRAGVSEAGESPAPAAILHLVTLSEWGGAQACVLALARGLAPAYNVTVGCGPGGPLVGRLRAEGIRVVEVPLLARSPSPLADFLVLWRLARWMRAERFALVHCHSTKAGLLGRFAAVLAGVPVRVFTAHGWPFAGWWHPVLRWAVVRAERLAARASTAIICVSEHDRRLALQMGIGPASKLRVIHNGVDPRRYVAAGVGRDPGSPSPSAVGPGIVRGGEAGRPCRVVSVGRLTHQKDPLTLLHAWRLVDGPHRLAIVGEGPIRGMLEAEIERSGLVGRVELLGARDDVPRLLGEFDVFALASRWEGLPLAIIEAMMCGLPVVATRVGGIPEVVHDGETGILVPAGDPAALARAIQRFVDDPALRHRAGAAGKDRALQWFTEVRMLRETADVYQDVIPAPR
ncbi:MAG: glycosyltransferase [Armatimonadota bacterium]|nr:glycosyltransferase [Armatimonadota bacterium]